MINFDVNDFKLYENYSISASAGTGKTYNIVGIVEKLIRSGIDISNILIVTYTEKAAGELVARIGGNLKEKKLNADMDKAHIGTIHSFCKDTLNAYYLSMGIPSHLSVIDESSLDSLYDEYLRDLLYDNKIEYSFLDKKTNYIQEIAKNLYLDKNGNIDPNIIDFDISPLDKFYVDFASKTTKCSFEELINIYSDCLNNCNDDIKPYYKRLVDAYKGLLSGDLLLYTNDETVKDYINSHSNLEISDIIKQAKKDKKLDEVTYEPIVKGLDKVNKNLGNASKIMDSIVNGGLKKVSGNYDLLSLPSFSIIKEIKNYKGNELLIFQKYAIEYYRLCQKVKENNSWITFDDMLREVREAVVHNDVIKNKIRKQYKYAIIDEFQDTNQLQWDIFKNVFLNSDDNYIIVVGDNKQSIYSFQGADLTVYNKAVKAIIDKGGNDCYLAKNYRSSRSMIEGYNALFKVPAFKSLNYNDVLVGKDDIYAKYNGEYIKAINIVLTKKTINDISTDEDYYITPNEYAEKCVEMIVDFCSKNSDGHTKLRIDKDERDVSFNDFMVLARSKSELSSFEYALTKAGVPYVKYKDDKLFNGIECAHWIALIEAIISPDFIGENRKTFRKALYTKFFGLSLKDISSSDFDRDDSPEMDLIMKWRELANEYRYDELIYSILTDSNLDNILGNISDIQSLNVFKQIGDYALTYLLNGNTLFLLKNNLINLSNGVSEDDDMGGTIVAKGTDFDCVELMTMHASKGLDRAVVFSVGGEAGIKNGSSVCVYHKNVSDSDGNSDIKSFITIKNDLNKGDITTENAEEKERLFYVAYTRARNLMFLPYYTPVDKIPVTNAIKEYILDSSNNELYNKCYYDEGSTIPTSELKKMVGNIIGDKKDSTIDIETIEKLKKLAKGMNKHFSYKHSYASMSKLKENNNIIDDNVNSNKEGEELDEALVGFDLNSLPANLEYSLDESFEIPLGFPKGAMVGTTLHEVFEKFEFTDIRKNNNLDLLIEERFKANKLRLKDEYREYVSNMVYNVLTAKLPIIRGNIIDLNNYFYLADIESKDRKAEAEFNFSELENGIFSNYCNGFIDLLFKRGDYYSILDWKSDTINNDDLLSYNNLTDIKTRVDGHYSIQRVLYSYTLISWLYDLGLEETKEEVFNKHFGGIYYVFIRGCHEDSYNGIYAQTWNSWSELESEFNKIMKICKYR